MFEVFMEFVGTAILILFGSGVVAAVNLKGSYAKDAGWLAIAIAWGLAVTLAVYAVGEFSGAHINPAVTLGFAMIGEFEWGLVLPYIVAQILGAAFGALLVWLAYLPHFKEEENPGTKLGVFSTAPAYPNYFSNFLSEIIGTFILVIGLLFIGANQFTEGLNPLVVGSLIVAIGLSLGGATGYAINPARDFGPRLAHFLLPIPNKGSSNFKYAIVPFLGPLIGGMLGATTYKFVFLGEFSIGFIISLVLTALTLVLGLLLNNRVLNNQETQLF